MDEQRKHAILFAATLLSARKLTDMMEDSRPNFAKEYWVDRAIGEAAFILERIDKRWPASEDGDHLRVGTASDARRQESRRFSAAVC